MIHDESHFFQCRLDLRVRAGRHIFARQLENAKPPMAITLPHDATIHEYRTPDAPSGTNKAFYPNGAYLYTKTFYAPPSGPRSA